MRARSADYITLQNVYKSKAKSDIDEVLAIVRKLEEQSERKTKISEKEVEEFCKNSASVKLIRGQLLRPAKSGEDINWAGQAKAAGKGFYNFSPLIFTLPYGKAFPLMLRHF